jgi:hypothetical protein
MKKRLKKENEKVMDANEANKDTSKLWKKLEGVIKSLEEETEATERCCINMELQGDPRELIKSIGKGCLKKTSSIKFCFPHNLSSVDQIFNILVSIPHN